jgi:hypothetical protein
VHRRLQCVAVALLLIGTVAIIANKRRIGKSVVPHTIHATTGAVALCGVASQAISGHVKHTEIVTSGRRVMRFHGKAGNVRVVVDDVMAGTLQLNHDCVSLCMCVRVGPRRSFCSCV